MKIGTFVMGGLAGAAVVMMIQRNQMMSAVANMVGQNLKQRMSVMKEDAIDKAFMKFSSSSKRSSDSAPSKHDSKASGGGLDRVKEIINQDPDVSSEINSILEQNGQHRI
jgi:hypothetical protein